MKDSDRGLLRPSAGRWSVDGVLLLGMLLYVVGVAIAAGGTGFGLVLVLVATPLVLVGSAGIGARMALREHDERGRSSQADADE